jgi:hypothetical protein
MKVWRADGSRYWGPLTGSHLWLNGNQFDAFHFSSGPYRIPLLPAGEYRIVLDNLFPDGTGLNAQTVLVRGADEVTAVEWQLPR